MSLLVLTQCISMQINIKSTGFDLTDAIRQHVELKINSLDKFLSRVESGVIADVEVGRTTDHHKSGEVFRAEVNITIPGEKMVREHVYHHDLYSAIDELKNKVAETLGSLGQKNNTLLRRGGRAVKNLLRGWNR